MTAASGTDPAHFLHEQLARTSPDLLRQVLTAFINTLMSAEADAVGGAEYGARSPERTNTRNGYRGREFDTRAGILEPARSRGCGPGPTSRVAARTAPSG